MAFSPISTAKAPHPPFIAVRPLTAAVFAWRITDANPVANLSRLSLSVAHSKSKLMIPTQRIPMMATTIMISAIVIPLAFLRVFEPDG
jgi:hypothetical protein